LIFEVHKNFFLQSKQKRNRQKRQKKCSFKLFDAHKRCDGGVFSMSLIQFATGKAPTWYTDKRVVNFVDESQCIMTSLVDSNIVYLCL